MFQNKKCEASVEDVAISFGPCGMLRSNVAECAFYCLCAKYQGSDKLILPYWVCVSQPYSDFFSILFLTILVKTCLSHFCIFHMLVLSALFRTRFSEVNLIPV